VSVRSCLVALLAVLCSSELLSADDPKPKSRDVYKDDLAGNEDVEKVIKGFAGKGAVGDDSQPTAPAEAVKLFQVADGLEMELVAAEPDVAQPLYMSFDPRGRMWVVQYLQYPFPAGLKVVKYDQYLRAVFDKVPPAPPHHFPGKDKITVFEDTDGDGKYDTHKDVITGLNIVSSVVAGHDGIWVLNPPYLLFYPDANQDDVPDADPEVHLSGFGLEDTHSVANSLCWGPDGWLYGANGSTTTATINSAVTKDVRFLGQCIWRYHPQSKVFEIYAEGGGNTFSLEIDSKGRVFSGTNGGGTRGMFYPQGSYGVKGWAKHGPLTNPFAFGYFEHMRHEGDGDRFPQTFSIYEADNLPEKYRGTVISANALHNRVWASELLSDTSTYKTIDFPPIVTTPDRWFRPVDIKLGPDGAVYLADWYDTRLTHVDPRDNWHKASGRIYRIQGKDHAKKDGKPFTAVDQYKLPDSELIALFNNPNRWVKQSAVRVLGWRLAAAKEPSPDTIAELAKIVRSKDGPALEALWTLNLAGEFDDALAAELLSHPDEHVRRWTVRLLDDSRRLSDALGQQLTGLARTEPYVQVRTQLASSAKRFETKQALPILRELIQRDEDQTDLHQPLLIWWGLEAHCGDVDQMLAFFADPKVWEIPQMQEVVLARLMQRYAMADVGETPGGNLAAPDAGTGLTTCAKLLALAPTPEHRKKLMAGFLEAYQGRKIESLPKELAAAIADHQKSLGETDLALGLRVEDAKAIDRALKLIADEKADRPTRLSVIELLGQTKPAKAMGPLTNLLASPAISIKRAALVALMNYDDASIGQQICGRYHSQLPDEQDLRSVAHRVLASRPAWTKALLNEVGEWRIKSNTISMDIVQQMRLHQDAEIQRLLDKHWGKTRASSEEKKAQATRLRGLIVKQKVRAAPAAGADANAAFDRGHEVFKKNCATCHTLFGEGGQTGPNLTGYERDNLDFLLLAVVDPSAAIREEFTQFIVVTKDGRVLNGLIDKQDARTVSLRGANNQATLLNKDDIEELKATETSIMPDGVTEKLSDGELLDLFTYVMTKAPPK
jgi:putative membrane-bound dehydrogenase-like protein